MTQLIDRYTFGARVVPALIVAFSLFFAMSAWVPFSEWPIKLVGGSALLIGAAFVLSQVVRDAGKAIEKPLWESWGGPPTVRMLRHGDGTFDPGTKAKIHRRLVELKVVDAMPSAEDERQDPGAADVVYRTCSEWLRSKALELKTKSPFDVVHHENISYGFRRNLLGIRIKGLVLAALSLLVALAAFYFGKRPYLELFGILAVGMVILGATSEEGVRRTADNYSERLLRAVDAIPLPAAKTTPARKSRSKSEEPSS